MITFSDSDYQFMRRALQLAQNGAGHVSPNPMVGAVIVAPDGRIIGEGWHRCYGSLHAEPNAVNSVADSDRHLIPLSTIYVTLEPCSHYGKTPPCAKLLVDKGFKRVVIGASDPNPLVSGRGVKMLRDAGIEVLEGLMAEESEALNKTFMTSQRKRRPFVTLKWARSADGFMDHKRKAGEPAARFSCEEGALLVHKRRSMHDAIAVGGNTAVMDNPRLNLRLLEGRSPRPVIFDRKSIANANNCTLIAEGKALHITDERPLKECLKDLFEKEKISSILVEGGASLLKEFIDNDMWDEAYVEMSPQVLGLRGTVPSPAIALAPVAAQNIGSNILLEYRNAI